MKINRKGLTFAVNLYNEKTKEYIIPFLQFSLRKPYWKPKAEFILDDKSCFIAGWLFIYFGFIQPNASENWKEIIM